MNKENCVGLNKNSSNVIKSNRPALIDKNNRNVLNNLVNNKIDKFDTMNNEAPKRVLRTRTKPRLTEQYPFKARAKSPAKCAKPTEKIDEICLDDQYMKSVRVALARVDVDTSVSETPTQFDVYEFRYDPKEEPPRKTKQKRGKHTAKDSDTSEDENNSMKGVMKKLRRRWRKPESGPKCTKTQKKTKTIEAPVRKPVQIKLIASKLVDEPTISKPIIQTAKPADKLIDESANLEADFDFETDSSFCSPIPKNVSNLYKSQNPKPLPNTQNMNFDAIFNMSSHNLKPTQNNNPKVISPPVEPSSESSLSPATTAQNVIQEVIDSFIEDEHPKTPIRVYSNVLLRTPRPEIFNSTLVTPLASPWRLNLSNICKSSYSFTVKKNSFTPAYDQDIIYHSRQKSHVYTNISASYTPNHSTHATAKESQEEYNSNHSTTKSNEVACHESTKKPLSKSLKKHQTSILSFIKSSKIHPSPSKRRQIGLFDDPIPDPPRKVLGSLNAQSTPSKQNTSILDISPEKSSDDSMFGFTYLSDAENKENSRVTRKCAPTRISIGEIKKVLEIHPPVVDNKQPELSEIDASAGRRKSIEINQVCDDVDSAGLFQDCEPELEVSKKINRIYTRKQPKRKRLLSVASNHSDDELDDATNHVKKKQKDKLTKQEQAEVNRLAEHYNSMFEDIDKHHLIIE